MEETVSLICISRQKRNMAVRQLADYRPYWFARDLRGSKGAKVRAEVDWS